MFKVWHFVSLLVFDLIPANCKSMDNGTFCTDVKRAFRRERIGPARLVPYYASIDQQLSICPSTGPTCCNNQMERRYIQKVNTDLSNVVDRLFKDMKERFINFSQTYKGDYESLIQASKLDLYHFTNRYLQMSDRNNHLNLIFNSFFNEMAMTKYGKLHKKETKAIHKAVYKFVGSLFSFKFEKENFDSLSSAERSCVARSMNSLPMHKRSVNILTEHVASATRLSSVFTKVIHSGINALNVTSRSFITPECQSALVKMKFCSHCRGLTQSLPCRGYCLNVLNGCLVGVSEIDRHWRYYVASFVNLINKMLTRGSDVQTLLATIDKEVKQLLKAPMHRRTVERIIQTCSLDWINWRGHEEDDAGMKRRAIWNGEEEMNNIRRSKHRSIGNAEVEKSNVKLREKIERFMLKLNESSNFFAYLSNRVCDSQFGYSHPSATFANSNCWDGTSVTDSYQNPIVGEGIEEQQRNPELQTGSLHPDTVDSVNHLKDSSKILRLGPDSKFLAFLHDNHEPPYNRSNHVNRNGSPCDDEDGCLDDESGDDDVELDNDLTTRDSNTERPPLQHNLEKIPFSNIENGEKVPFKNRSIDIKKDSKLSRISDPKKIFASKQDPVTPRNSATRFLNLSIYCWTLAWQLIYILISHFLL